MRVAIDSGPLVSGHKVRGIGVHTKELIEAIKKLKDENIKIETVDFSKADLSRYDIVHYQNFNPFFFSIPFNKPAKKVVLTIHDLIPLIYPKHYPGGLKGTLRFWIQKFLIQNVDAVITISETSKKDICRFLSVHPDKVHVIYLAPRKIFRQITDDGLLSSVKRKYNLPEKFVLYVGDVNYNKNIPTLTKACRIAKMPLIICGKQALEIDAKELNHPELAHLRGIDFSGVLRLGFVPDTDLVAIYNLASLYCQPSLYEGFGLPVLEAFACETAVVASKTQALVEIGEAGALFANPNDAKDFAEKMLKLVKDEELREELINTGKVIVKNYSWEKTARETLNVYKKIYED